LYRALYRTGFANQARSVSKDDGLELRDCYIAAAVRCAPPENKPTRTEFARCQPFLVRETLLLPALRIVVVLGAVAMDAFLRVWRMTHHEIPSPRPRFRHEGTWSRPPRSWPSPPRKSRESRAVSTPPLWRVHSIPTGFPFSPRTTSRS